MKSSKSHKSSSKKPTGPSIREIIPLSFDEYTRCGICKFLFAEDTNFTVAFHPQSRCLVHRKCIEQKIAENENEIISILDPKPWDELTTQLLEAKMDVDTEFHRGRIAKRLLAFSGIAQILPLHPTITVCCNLSPIGRHFSLSLERYMPHMIWSNTLGALPSLEEDASKDVHPLDTKHFFTGSFFMAITINTTMLSPLDLAAIINKLEEKGEMALDNNMAKYALSGFIVNHTLKSKALEMAVMCRYALPYSSEHAPDVTEPPPGKNTIMLTDFLKQSLMECVENHIKDAMPLFVRSQLQFHENTAACYSFAMWDSTIKDKYVFLVNVYKVLAQPKTARWILIQECKDEDGNIVWPARLINLLPEQNDDPHEDASFPMYLPITTDSYPCTLLGQFKTYMYHKHLLEKKKKK